MPKMEKNVIFSIFCKDTALTKDFIFWTENPRGFFTVSQKLGTFLFSFILIESLSLFPFLTKRDSLYYQRAIFWLQLEELTLYDKFLSGAKNEKNVHFFHFWHACCQKVKKCGFFHFLAKSAGSDFISLPKSEKIHIFSLFGNEMKSEKDLDKQAFSHLIKSNKTDPVQKMKKMYIFFIFCIYSLCQKLTHIEMCVNFWHQRHFVTLQQSKHFFLFLLVKTICFSFFSENGLYLHCQKLKKNEFFFNFWQRQRHQKVLLN